MKTINLNQSIAHIVRPARMGRLPLSPKGYPVPWFVAWVDDVPDFRVVRPDRIREAITKQCCWLCGHVLGSYKCFVIGPMCSINRVSAEPPSHLECAQYAVVACPFLSKPNMRRNDNDMPEGKVPPPGIMIERNPGVSALWVTKKFSKIRANNGILFKIGNPTNVMWYTQGRPATRAEVDESIRTGLPALEAEAEKESHQAVLALKWQIEMAKKHLP